MSELNVRAVVFVGLLVGMSAVHAQSLQPGFYGGIAFGQSKVEPKFENGSLRGDQDKNGVGAKVFLGYQLNETWSVEGQYQELGRWKYTDSTNHIEAKVAGWGIAGLGRMPIADRTHLLGKLGAVVQTFQVDANNTKGGTYSHSFSATTPLVGIGLEYQLQPGIALRAEYEYFGVPTLTESVNQKLKAHTSLLSVGLTYRY